MLLQSMGKVSVEIFDTAAQGASIFSNRVGDVLKFSTQGMLQIALISLRSALCLNPASSDS